MFFFFVWQTFHVVERTEIDTADHKPTAASLVMPHKRCRRGQRKEKRRWERGRGREENKRKKRRGEERREEDKTQWGSEVDRREELTTSQLLTLRSIAVGSNPKHADKCAGC